MTRLSERWQTNAKRRAKVIPLVSTFAHESQPAEHVDTNVEGARRTVAINIKHVLVCPRQLLSNDLLLSCKEKQVDETHKVASPRGFAKHNNVQAVTNQLSPPACLEDRRRNFRASCRQFAFLGCR